MKKGWNGESQRHSLAKKGVKTAKLQFKGTGRSMHGYLDRSWDEYNFTDKDGEDISVYIYTEPDWTDREYDSEWEDRPKSKKTPAEYEKYIKKVEEEFYEKGNGQIDVIWAGGLDFTGTEKEFKTRYPDLYGHLKNNMITGV